MLRACCNRESTFFDLKSLDGGHSDEPLAHQIFKAEAVAVDRSSVTSLHVYTCCLVLS